MTEPTDAELTECYKAANGEDVGKAQPLTTKRIFRAMRAAIAKWGTPPAVAGEPVAWEAAVTGYIKYVTQSQYERFSNIAKSGYKPYKCSNCTATQPTQAQAGAITPPPIECNTEDLKKAYAFGWWSALEKQRETVQAGAVPLTDEQLWANDEIMSLNADLGWHMDTIRMFTRVIERAHGIKGGQHAE